ncbi:unnamed protein product [Hymenolepis diminuta]|uniref:Uncharacterized protein n=1 Tax=Hymenolepis diminuta TaxID=6216 RepID=A0A564YUT1_HYMDI|nr:unnamed protein product [Hymenolepis diminuta]
MIAFSRVCRPELAALLTSSSHSRASTRLFSSTDISSRLATPLNTNSTADFAIVRVVKRGVNF